MSKSNLLYKNIINNEFIYLIFLALLTAIAGEIKVIPFNGEMIRFGLGSVTFFLLALIRPPVSLLKAGFVTGVVVALFRVFLDLGLNDISLLSSLKNHLPATLFYLLFALGLSIIDLEKYKKEPLLLGLFTTGFEIVSNSMEHFVRSLLLHNAHLNLQEWTILCGVALIRSYFVVGLYGSITISEQRKRIQEMLSVGSELYAETLYLQKSMNHIEQITASSHDLYRRLKKQHLDDLSVQALNITQEIHEVKKDTQRIYSGLSKITNQKKEAVFLLSDLLHFVMIANENYSKMLKKNITFNLSISIDFDTDQQVPLLALLNNLAANAVESIEDMGEITFELFEKAGYTCFFITDSGKGFPKDDVSVVFEPGYTTKFSEQGVAATGIGLSHVKEIVNNLGGEIHVETANPSMIFQVSIPSEKIRKW